MATGSSLTDQNLAGYCEELARRAQQASRFLRLAARAQKDSILRAAATRLRIETEVILAANAEDVARAASYGLTPAQLDRLRLNEGRVAEMARALEKIADLPDPVGEIIDEWVRPDGLKISRVRVPLGVILFIYESRPNVTVDAVALCLKSGNAVILRGGKEAQRSNEVLHRLLAEEIEKGGLPPDGAVRVDVQDREAVGHLLKLDRYIDLAIPRGGESLIRRVAEEARMPVLKHYKGICHVYVDRDADLDMARQIVINAKCQRPSTCNAAECLLVDAAIADQFMPVILRELLERGVEVRGCPRTVRYDPRVVPAREEDYATEYLDLKISARVVDSLDEAVDHIHRFGSGHTEAIVTSNPQRGQEFAAKVNSAAIMINASTRLCDGGEFGLGAEIGISTDKFHARGPCGLRELTTYKYVVVGSGHLRGG